MAISGFGQIAVTQMISENHDTLFFLNWLTQWLKNGVHAPDEIVCDYSRALLSAFCKCNYILCSNVSSTSFCKWLASSSISFKTKERKIENELARISNKYCLCFM